MEHDALEIRFQTECQSNDLQIFSSEVLGYIFIVDYTDVWYFDVYRNIQHRGKGGNSITGADISDLAQRVQMQSVEF